MSCLSSKFFPGTGQRVHWVYCYMARHVTFLPMAAWCRCHVGLSKSLLPRGCRTTVIPHVLICGVQTFLTLAPQQNLHEVDRSVFLRPPFFDHDFGRSKVPRTLCSPSRIARARVAPTPAPQPWRREELQLGNKKMNHVLTLKRDTNDIKII